MAPLRALWRDESGATAVEYVLIGAVVATIMIIGMTYLGQVMEAKFSYISSSVVAAS